MVVLAADSMMPLTPRIRGRARLGTLEARDSARFGAWLGQQDVAMLVGTLAALWLGSAVPIALAGAVSFALLAVRWRHEGGPAPGSAVWANAVTAFRLVLLLGVAASMHELPRLVVFTAFMLNVVLDVADGAVARYCRGVTRFGRIFDREADGVFVLVAYMYFAFVEGIAAWIILPGIAPYVYRLLMRAMHGGAVSEERESLAAVLAGTNFVLLTGAIVLPSPVREAVLVVSASVVVLSFLVSFMKYRGDAGPPS